VRPAAAVDRDEREGDAETGLEVVLGQALEKITRQGGTERTTHAAMLTPSRRRLSCTPEWHAAATDMDKAPKM